MLIRYVCAWFILMIAAMGNGLMREAWFKDVLGDLHAHQASTLTLIILLGAIVWVMQREWPLPSRTLAWRVGFIWLGMTLAFETLFGHYVAGHSWERVFAEYDLVAGRVWLLVLVWILFAPVIIRGLQTRMVATRRMPHLH